MTFNSGTGPALLFLTRPGRYAARFAKESGDALLLLSE